MDAYKIRGKYDKGKTLPDELTAPLSYEELVAQNKKYFALLKVYRDLIHAVRFGKHDKDLLPHIRKLADLGEQWAKDYLEEKEG